MMSQVAVLPDYTVTELSLALKRSVETAFSHVRVRGEISGLKRHGSGHTYFALKDQDSVLDGICWRGSCHDSQHLLQDGIEVIVTGRLTTYPGRSKYQIVITHVEEAGQGALQKLLEELKQKLTAEGLFAEARKRPLPFLPRVVGIITSPTGAVIQDILHRLEDRFPLSVILWPVAVQGEGAASQVVTALEGFNQMADNRPDLLIVARGGGSLEDLWAFNEENVVRAIGLSQIPVISAIGHETDVTLADFAADKRAPTPTAAAEFAVPVRTHVAQTLAQTHLRLTTLFDHLCTLYESRLGGIVRGLPPLTIWLEERAQRLDDLGERLKMGGMRFVEHKKISLDAMKERLDPVLNTCLSRFAQQFETQAKLLESYSYSRTLERGFAFVTAPDGTLLTAASAIKPAQEMDLHFHDGRIRVAAT